MSVRSAARKIGMHLKDGVPIFGERKLTHWKDLLNELTDQLEAKDETIQFLKDEIRRKDDRIGELTRDRAEDEKELAAYRLADAMRERQVPEDDGAFLLGALKRPPRLAG